MRTLLGQIQLGRPEIRIVQPASQPVDGDLLLDQSLELSQQELEAIGTRRFGAQQVTGEHQEIHLLPYRLVNDSLCRTKRSLEELVVQFRRHLGHTPQRLLQLPIGGMQESNTFQRHRHLLAHESIGYFPKFALPVLCRSRIGVARATKLGHWHSQWHPIAIQSDRHS